MNFSSSVTNGLYTHLHTHTNMSKNTLTHRFKERKNTNALTRPQSYKHTHIYMPAIIQTITHTGTCPQSYKRWGKVAPYCTWSQIDIISIWTLGGRVFNLISYSVKLFFEKGQSLFLQRVALINNLSMWKLSYWFLKVLGTL